MFLLEKAFILFLDSRLGPRYGVSKVLLSGIEGLGSKPSAQLRKAVIKSVMRELKDKQIY